MSEQVVQAAVVNLIDEDGAYHATQTDSDVVTSPGDDVENSCDISWGHGPVEGWLDTGDSGTLDVGLVVSILGISIGPLLGNLNDGVKANIDLFQAKGKTKFYLRNGNQLWVRLDLSVTFNGTYHNDFKIDSW